MLNCKCNHSSVATRAAGLKILEMKTKCASRCRATTKDFSLNVNDKHMLDFKCAHSAAEERCLTEGTSGLAPKMPPDAKIALKSESPLQRLIGHE